MRSTLLRLCIALKMEDLKPRWDEDRRELWYGNLLCKQFIRNAPNQFLVLQSFQELNWPHHLDDPLAKGKLANTIHDLQDALRDSPIEIGRGGDGRSITWRAVAV
jgi:hypothetical protein